MQRSTHEWPQGQASRDPRAASGRGLRVRMLAIVLGIADRKSVV